MFVLGLTGSLGMGKSTTAGFFAELGIPVHDADAAVHRLYRGEAAPLIEAAFPGTMVNGEVDREKLAKRVLDDPAAIKKLEGIVHPLVRAAEEHFLAEAERNDARVAVLDIPLLFETGGDRRCDAVVVVSAPEDVQRARIFERSGMTAQKFAAISANQMPDAEKRKRADFVVDTSKGFDAARAQIREILARIATMTKRRQ
ncbi:MAG TPA: dephospho-CoA kinase [Pseudolabrys sp.]|nr:dephospho-CoA kinase [Pseudolabrys sp.]